MGAVYAGLSGKRWVQERPFTARSCATMVKPGWSPG